MIKSGWRNAGLCLLAAAFGLAACDNGPSAVDARAERPSYEERIERRAAEPAGAYAERGAETRDPRPERRAERTPTLDGRPLWSSNRRYDAEENARRHFERNGEALGARNYDDFLKKVHAFTGDPPRGALTLKRANGDTLIYEPKQNLFAVVTADGAPRTMFKPDDGMAYWERQKTREAQGGSRRANSGAGEDARS